MKKPIRGPFFLEWVFLMSRYRAGGLLRHLHSDILVGILPHHYVCWWKLQKFQDTALVSKHGAIRV